MWFFKSLIVFTIALKAFIAIILAIIAITMFTVEAQNQAATTIVKMMK